MIAPVRACEQPTHFTLPADLEAARYRVWHCSLAQRWHTCCPTLAPSVTVKRSRFPEFSGVTWCDRVRDLDF